MRCLRYRIIMAICMLVFFMAGCRNTDSGNSDSRNYDSTNYDSENNDSKNSGLNHQAVSWQADYTPLENPYFLALATDRIYGCHVRDGQICLDIIDKQEISAKETLTVPDASLLVGMAADQEGYVYLMGNKGKIMGLWRIAPKGKLQDFEEMELEDTEKSQDLFLKGIYKDQSGTLFIWCEMSVREEEGAAWHKEDRVYVKDAQLKTCFYEKIADVGGTDVLSFQVGTDGKPIFIIKDSDGVYAQKIDTAQQGRKDAARLEKPGEFLDTEYINGIEKIVPVEDGFLYCQNYNLFVFNYKTQSIEKLFNLSTYGIFSYDLLFLKKDGDVIEMIDNHEETGNPEFISFVLGEAGKRIVTLGSTSMLPYLEKVVAEFNRCSGEYRVEIVDYVAQAGNYEDGVDRLKLDVVSGKAPDLITVGASDYEMLSKKGAFADLYGFMKEDEECPGEALVQPVVKAYEEQGHLYRISPSFQLHSMWGYGDVTGGRSGVTFDELFQMLEDSGKDLNSIAGFSADEPVLARLCRVSMDEFVDWGKGTCNFEGDYFKKVLSFAKEYTGNYTGGAYSERIGRREVVMSVGIISSVTDYQIQNALYGGNAAFVGYPVAEGSGTAVAFRADAVAINAGSGEQAGAWEFVKFYLMHGYDGQGFPIVREQFDRVLEAAMVDEYAVSEDGGTEKCPKESYNDGGEIIIIYAASPEDVDAVRGLVESAGTRCEWNSAVMNIINEEAQGYFSGQMDLDGTVKKIQNRVTLFLQESS